jgi:hypothetical protein
VDKSYCLVDGDPIPVRNIKTSCPQIAQNHGLIKGSTDYADYTGLIKGSTDFTDYTDYKNLLSADYADFHRLKRMLCTEICENL